MGQNVIDTDTVGFGNFQLGGFYDFHVNNTFYLLAPEYYFSFYATYLRRCLTIYDGWCAGFHNDKTGLVPQRALQSIGRGLTNMLFAHGIDFSGSQSAYQFALKWNKKSNFYNALMKSYEFAVAGGTSLLKINRSNKELFVSAHRIDTFFIDQDSTGKITSAEIFFDAIHNTNPSSGAKEHFGICEKRYFNDDNQPCVKATIYRCSGNLQTSVSERLEGQKAQEVNWENLPFSVRQSVKKNYPSIFIGKEQYLPFSNSLGLFVMKFTDTIPQIPNSPFGQPIGDTLFTESFQYDQIKYFEKNEVDLARARALVPEDFWNKDDPDASQRNLNERFYQKVSSINADNDKITPIQFLLRGNDIRTQKENILRDIAFKLNISSSSIASFLNEGAGAKTATEIISERTKTDTFIKGQINLNSLSINNLLKIVMLYYNKDEVEIIFKNEDQSPFIEKLKANSDVLSAGNMSPELFVRQTYSNLSQSQQQKEIEYLIETQNQKSQAILVNNFQPQVAESSEENVVEDKIN